MLVAELAKSFAEKGIGYCIGKVLWVESLGGFRYGNAKTRHLTLCIAGEGAANYRGSS